MNTVYVIPFTNESEVRIAATKEKAYEICKEYIENCYDEETAAEALREFEEEYRNFPDSFSCEDICWVERVEVE